MARQSEKDRPVEKIEIKFDPARPHDEICGQPGLSFSQDGYSFNGAGQLITDFSKLNPVDEPESKPEAEDETIPRCITLEETPQSIEQEKTANLEGMHWKTLQKLCGLYGISYVDREQALAALKGK